VHLSSAENFMLILLDTHMLKDGTQGLDCGQHSTSFSTRHAVDVMVSIINYTTCHMHTFVSALPSTNDFNVFQSMAQ
jgi:hypothetical protein